MEEEEGKKRTRKGEIYIGDIVHYFLVYTTPRCKPEVSLWISAIDHECVYSKPCPEQGMWFSVRAFVE